MLQQHRIFSFHTLQMLGFVNLTASTGDDCQYTLVYRMTQLTTHLRVQICLTITFLISVYITSWRTSVSSSWFQIMRAWLLWLSKAWDNIKSPRILNHLISACSTRLLSLCFSPPKKSTVVLITRSASRAFPVRYVQQFSEKRFAFSTKLKPEPGVVVVFRKTVSDEFGDQNILWLIQEVTTASL